MDLLLAPHNDDEALFAAFTCLRYKPHVAVCLRSFKQDRNWQRRELETSKAMRLLGCTWEQWDIPDNAPNWPFVKALVERAAWKYDRCFAPYPRFSWNGWTGSGDVPPDGVCQHDRIGEIAQTVFGDRYTGYLTYTKAGKDVHGDPVPFEPEWPLLKLQALLCYESQIRRPEIVPHFLGDLNEYYAR